MPFNGSGVFQRVHNWVNDATAGILIRADRHDAEDDNIASGLSQCITKDGQTTITANLPMASFRHTGVGAATSATDYARFDQVQLGKAVWVAAGGTSDAITAAYSPATAAPVDGQLYYVRAGAANTTTTPTFSPNGNTARTIVKLGNQALVPGDIAGSGHELIFRYRASDTKYELLNPSGNSILSTDNNFTGENEFSNTVFMTGAALNEAKGANLASASTVNIGAATGNTIHITGTTTITAFDSAQAGTRRTLIFDNSLILTHNATSLILPGEVNITVSAGDVFDFVSEGSGNWRCVGYQLKSGFTLSGVKVLGYEYAQSGTSGTTTTVIPIDNTIPQITEGTEALSVVYSRKSAASTLRIKWGALVSGNGSIGVTVALFNGATDAISGVPLSTFAVNGLVYGGGVYEQASGGTGNITFSLRYGPNTGTAYINGNNSIAGNALGGICPTFIEITEVE